MLSAGTALTDTARLGVERVPVLGTEIRQRTLGAFATALAGSQDQAPLRGGELRTVGHSVSTLSASHPRMTDGYYFPQSPTLSLPGISNSSRSFTSNGIASTAALTRSAMASVSGRALVSPV